MSICTGIRCFEVVVLVHTFYKSECFSTPTPWPNYEWCLCNFHESEVHLPQDVSSESSDSDEDVMATAQPSRWRPATWQPVVNVFLDSQGPIVAAQVSNCEGPVEYFMLFFTADVLGKVVVVEKNRYVAQARAANPFTPCKISKVKPWTDVTEEELKTYIGLVMMIGFLKKTASLHLIGVVTTALNHAIFLNVYDQKWIPADYLIPPF